MFVHCVPVLLAARRRLTNCDSISGKVRFFHYSISIDMPSGNHEDACAMDKGDCYPEHLKLDARLDVALGLRISCKFSCSDV
jgi:hypothetical protein